MNTERIRIEFLRLKQTENEQAKRAANPDGLHRLASLVPEYAPDQESLARALAEFAYESREHDLEPGAASIKVREKFDMTKPARLAQQAQQCPIAWAACELWIDPQNRSRFEHDTKGKARKVLYPIPEPIQELMAQCFTGKVQCLHGYNDNTERDDVIRFMVWSALEANIKATSRTGKPNACEIVGSIIGENKSNIAMIWKGRKHKKGRAGKYA